METLLQIKQINKNQTILIRQITLQFNKIPQKFKLITLIRQISKGKINKVWLMIWQHRQLKRKWQKK